MRQKGKKDMEEDGIQEEMKNMEKEQIGKEKEGIKEGIWKD